MKGVRLCDIFTDEEWLVLVESLASFIERHNDVDFLAEDVEVAKRLLKRFYGIEV